MKTGEKYLGDSVYVSFDGFDFTLYLNNGEGLFNKIVLEPIVLAELQRFVEDCSRDRFSKDDDEDDSNG